MVLATFRLPGEAGWNLFSKGGVQVYTEEAQIENPKNTAGLSRGYGTRTQVGVILSQSYIFAGSLLGVPVKVPSRLKPGTVISIRL